MMRRVLVVTLSVLMLSAFSATIAQAEGNTANPATTNPEQPTTSSLSPNDLFSLAYRGAFRVQGIPGYPALACAYVTRQVTARDLIRVAIDVKKLPPATLSDTRYLNVVDTKLANLSRSCDR
ncbi:hypothetical protein Ple7327_2753 [Pleurocapsa sp. PCC 7327]|uniref:hypothetical protein n=1 Tax=Pleurocapsa sp. PCC 7327 TaxID=118163 RepID=UPI00029F96D2|nr:hypothetical protein [Pleurocapsa sp. PCC 7327]AFY78023.1 hypothetical protein Ple7327_2753 [Pleurocapsa sp. PCC 7327]